MIPKKFRGCGATQFNVYVTVRAASEEQAKRKIENFFNNSQGQLDFNLKIQGKEIEVTFDECFEVMDVIEKK